MAKSDRLPVCLGRKDHVKPTLVYSKTIMFTMSWPGLGKSTRSVSNDEFSLAKRKAGQLGALLFSPGFMTDGTVMLVLLVDRREGR